MTSPLGVLSGCLEAAFSAAHLIDSPQLQGSSCLGWVMVPEVQLVVTTYAERFIEQVGAQVSCMYCVLYCQWCWKCRTIVIRDLFWGL